MLEMKEKIIFYLTFAKSKLNDDCIAYQKAKEEIDTIIEKLKSQGSD